MMFKKLLYVLGAVSLLFPLGAVAKESCELELHKDAQELVGEISTAHDETSGYYCGNWKSGAPSYIVAMVIDNGDTVRYAYRVQLQRRNHDFKGKTEVSITDDGLKFSFHAGGGSRVTATIKDDELHASYLGPNGKSVAVMKRQNLDQVSLVK